YFFYHLYLHSFPTRRSSDLRFNTASKLVNKVLNRLTILPRWVIILIDLSLILFAVSLAFLLRFNFEVNLVIAYKPAFGIALTLAVSLVSTLITKSYAGIVRYTGIQDGIRIIQTELLSLGLLLLGNLVYYYNLERNAIPYSVIFI